MDDLFTAELRERLFTHFTGGAWRVPRATRALDVPGGEGRGRIVCGDEADAARAMQGLAAGARVDEARLWGALEARADMLNRLRAEEGFAGDVLARRPSGAVPVGVEGTGPWVVLSAASVPVSALVALLVAAMARGVIWKPAPRAAASAHLIVDAIGPLAGSRLAMVQGDHATGAALAGLTLAGAGLLVWAGAGQVPAGLPAPAFTLSGAARGHP